MYIKPRCSVLNSQPVKSTTIVAVLLAAFGIVGYFDAEDEQAQREHYCEMVAVWKADAARGIPANDRAGWPAYNGERMCK